MYLKKIFKSICIITLLFSIFLIDSYKVVDANSIGLEEIESNNVNSKQLTIEKPSTAVLLWEKKVGKIEPIVKLGEKIINNANLNYKSENNEIAKVTQTGRITGIKAGITNIVVTATYTYENNRLESTMKYKVWVRKNTFESSLNTPPTMIVQTNKEKLDDVVITFSDNDGLTPEGITFYRATIEEGKKTINKKIEGEDLKSFLAADPEVIETANGVNTKYKYLISNEWLQNNKRTLFIKAVDNTQKELLTYLKINTSKTHYKGQDIPPRVRYWSNEENAVSFTLTDYGGTSYVRIYDVNENNKLKYEAREFKEADELVTFDCSRFLKGQNGKYKVMIEVCDKGKNKMASRGVYEFSLPGQIEEEQKQNVENKDNEQEEQKQNQNQNQNNEPEEQKQNQEYINVPAPYIELNKTQLNLQVGERNKIESNTYPKNAMVTWKSNNPNIATVNNLGEIEGKNEGRVLITASITVNIRSIGEETATASCLVNVSKKPENIQTIIYPDRIELKEYSATLEIGETKQIFATIYPENATNKSIKWKSDNENIAKVSNNGLITAINEGKTYIWGETINNKITKFIVNVNKKQIEEKSIKINKSYLILNVGNSEQLTATIEPTNATNKNVTWTSADESIVSVNQNGLLLAKKKGITYIKAKSNNGKLALCLVIVNSKTTENYVTENKILYKVTYKDGKLYSKVPFTGKYDGIEYENGVIKNNDQYKITYVYVNKRGYLYKQIFANGKFWKEELYTGIYKGIKYINGVPQN